MAYDLTDTDRTALVWQMGEAETAAWLARAEKRPDATAVIANKIAACTARMLASPDKRSREERDADQSPPLPTKLETEMAQARVYAERQSLLAAAKELGLKEAEAYLTAEAAKLEATDR